MRPFPRPDDADTLRALCRNAAGVVVQSASARRALATTGIAPPQRVAVVPPGPAPELLASPGTGRRPAALAGCGAGPVLTTMGHLSPARGIEVAIAALQILTATCNAVGRGIAPSGRSTHRRGRP